HHPPSTASLLFSLLGDLPISPLFPYPTLFRSRRDVVAGAFQRRPAPLQQRGLRLAQSGSGRAVTRLAGKHREVQRNRGVGILVQDRKSTRLNSSHVKISYAVFCLKKKNRRIPS